MDRERFEPVTHHANPALWGAYSLDILRSLVEPATRPGDPQSNGEALARELSPEEEHRLQLLAEFLESAKRGALPLPALRETHQSRISALAAPKHASRRPVSLTHDIEAFDLLSELLPTASGGGPEPSPEECVIRWVDDALEALSLLKEKPWSKLSDVQKRFVAEELMLVLSRLARLTHAASYKVRGPWNVVAV